MELTCFLKKGSDFLLEASQMKAAWASTHRVFRPLKHLHTHSATQGCVFHCCVKPYLCWATLWGSAGEGGLCSYCVLTQDSPVQVTWDMPTLSVSLASSGKEHQWPIPVLRDNRTCIWDRLLQMKCCAHVSRGRVPWVGGKHLLIMMMAGRGDCCGLHTLSVIWILEVY